MSWIATGWNRIRSIQARSWKACANNLMRIHLAPDGKTLYTGGGDGLARTWQLPDGKEVPLPEGYIGLPVFAWSRARNAMAVGDGQGRIDRELSPHPVVYAAATRHASEEVDERAVIELGQDERGLPFDAPFLFGLGFLAFGSRWLRYVFLD